MAGAARRPTPLPSSKFNRDRLLALNEKLLETVDILEAKNDAQVRMQARLRDQALNIAKLAADRQRWMADALDAEDRTRRRIAQALHDEVLPELFAARQDIGEALASAGEPSEMLEQAQEGVVRAIDWLRDAMLDLHPIALDDAGLAAALSAMTGRFAERAGFAWSVSVDPAAEGHRDQLIVALVRELVTNVAKHAEATSVAVEVRASPTLVLLEVRDDGRGMAPGRPDAAVSGGHIGLATTRQRVEAIDGRFDLTSVPGRGTTVRISLPRSPSDATAGD